MGKGQSKGVGPPPVGPIVDIMLSKYGPECISVLNNWSNEFGFPQGGSLSTDQLKKLQENLCKEEKIRGLEGKGKLKRKI